MKLPCQASAFSQWNKTTLRVSLITYEEANVQGNGTKTEALEQEAKTRSD